MGRFHQFLTFICLWHNNDGVLSFYVFILEGREGVGVGMELENYFSVAPSMLNANTWVLSVWHIEQKTKQNNNNKKKKK